jgi:DNA-3-methyladenine glycosylase I
VHGEAALFERLALEGFQTGLSWLVVLRKRDAFREAFSGFDPEAVARFDEADVARCLGDARIVRNRAKIEATIAGARAVVALREAGRPLEALIWSHRPPRRPRPRRWADVPASTPQSEALARELKAAGFRFLGPVTVYAAMQACGLVNDHLVGCPAGDRLEAER